MNTLLQQTLKTESNSSSPILFEKNNYFFDDENEDENDSFTLIEPSAENPIEIKRQEIPYVNWNKLQVIETAEILDAYRVRDFFLIDVEGMLELFGAVSRYCEEDSLVDLSHGAPTLHIAYMLESFLSKLNTMEVKYQFVYFEQFPIFSRAEKVEFNCVLTHVVPKITEADKFIVKTMLTHLVHLNQTVHEFSSFHSEEFEYFIKHSNPALFFTSSQCILTKMKCHTLGFPTAESLLLRSNKIFAKIVQIRRHLSYEAKSLINGVEIPIDTLCCSLSSQKGSKNRVETIFPVLQTMLQDSIDPLEHYLSCCVLVTCWLQEILPVNKRGVAIADCPALNEYLAKLYAILQQNFDEYCVQCKVVCDIFDTVKHELIRII